MKKYLVTGAAGFIGSAVAKRLLNEGNEVWTIDNLSTGFKHNLPEGIHFIEGGCQEEASIQQLQGTQFDAILHFAGQSSGEVSFDDPVYDLRTNTESTLRLIQYGLSHNCQRFIYASSMSVYGEVPDQAISEERVPNPLSFYGVGKLASEHYLRLFQSKGLLPTSLRLFNAYGPHQNMENLRQGMVSIYLAQMIFQDKIIVKGDNARFRDFIYIDDIVNFTIQTLNDSNSYGETINVGTGVRTSVDELLAMLKTISEIDKPIEYQDNTPGDQRGIYAEISKLKNKFGFQCQYSLEQGLKEMIQWAKSRV